MNTSRINPFNELYVTETVSPQDFVTLFSPVLIKDALSLFQPGNVVVKGVQGSGKSMLLNLLKPEIRIAYAKAGEPLPLPDKLRRFISGGINLIRSAAIDFGQRATDTAPGIDMQRLPLYFGDFVNYWIVYDLFQTIELLSSSCEGAIARDLELAVSSKRLNEFARLLASDDCWYGYLDRVTDYPSLKRTVEERISTYRRFLNFTLDTLPEAVKSTTTPVGQPISRAVQWLRRSAILPRTVPVFIRIDQYEELCRLEDWSGGLGLKYRRLINKALGLRDPRLSYRIGARRYAWHDDLQLYGTASVLELERDYKLVDIDEILRRKENRRTWVFPDFAEDVFRRRLSYLGYTGPALEMRSVIDDNVPPTAIARRYARNSVDRVIVAEESWPRSIVRSIAKLAVADPLSAKLAEAWLRQRPGSPLPRSFPVYWKKERVQQALMQIAARCGQRMMWAGKEDVLALSGGNILVFVSVCQHIWSAWARSVRGLNDAESQLVLPKIDVGVQAIGIQSASVHWYNKIPEQLGKSRERQRFVDRLGRLFREQLIQDKAMSYPGHNGFSLREEDLDRDGELLRFLNDAVDYGDLFDAPHTTKSKDRKPRRKWYLNPILSPHFQIPETHVKEPMYVGIAEVRKWLADAGVSGTALTRGPATRKTRIPRVAESQLSFSADFTGDQ